MHGKGYQATLKHPSLYTKENLSPCEQTNGFLEQKCSKVDICDHNTQSDIWRKPNQVNCILTVKNCDEASNKLTYGHNTWGPYSYLVNFFSDMIKI